MPTLDQLAADEIAMRDLRRILGLPNPGVWSPADLGSPPALLIDAERRDLITCSNDGRSITALTAVSGQAANATTGVVWHPGNPNFNFRPCFIAGNAADTMLNFTTAAAGILANKAACTMMLFGRFPAMGTAQNDAIVNVATNGANATRVAIASSSGGAHNAILRYTVRKADGDAANGDDLISVGLLPFSHIIRMDNTGAVKSSRIICGGQLSTASEATGLGTGTFSNTNSTFVGWFNAGNTNSSDIECNYSFIHDGLYDDATCEMFEGMAWHRAGYASHLPTAHTYRSAPP